YEGRHFHLVWRRTACKKSNESPDHIKIPQYMTAISRRIQVRTGLLSEATAAKNIELIGNLPSAQGMNQSGSGGNYCKNAAVVKLC
ncbi:MAG: hypothetical protein AAGA87_18025, partial [Pseudomonadota bacterium]